MGACLSIVAVAVTGALLGVAPAAHTTPLDTPYQFGTVGRDSATDMTVLGHTAVVVGTTDGTLPGETSAGGRDIFVRALDATSLAPLWTDQFGSDQADDGVAVAAYGDAIYVLARTLGTVVGPTNLEKTDWVVRKYLDDGTPVWTKQFGTAYNEPALGIAASSQGVFVVGNSVGEPPPGVGQRPPYTRWARRLDTEGNVVWTVPQDTTPGDNGWAALDVDVDDERLYILAHASSGFALPITSESLITMTLDGQPIGARQLSSSPGKPALHADDFAVHDGTVYVVGQTHAGPTDPYAAAYTSAGDRLWRHIYTSTDYDRFLGVSAGPQGAVAVGTTHPGDYSTLDVVVRKLNRSGETVWSERAGSPDADYLYSVAFAGDGVLAGGFTAGTWPGSTSSGGDDALVLRFRGARPDLTLRGPTGATVGADLYAPERQRTRGRIKPGATQKFTVRVGNDGEIAEPLRVQGCGNDARLVARYVSGGKDVTRAVRRGRWSTSVEPGRTVRVTLFLTVRGNVADRTKVTCAISSRTAGPSPRVDKVVVSARTTPPTG